MKKVDTNMSLSLIKSQVKPNKNRGRNITCLINSNSKSVKTNIKLIKNQFAASEKLRKLFHKTK